MAKANGQAGALGLFFVFGMGRKNRIAESSSTIPSTMEIHEVDNSSRPPSHAQGKAKGKKGQVILARR